MALAADPVAGLSLRPLSFAAGAQAALGVISHKAFRAAQARIAHAAIIRPLTPIGEAGIDRVRKKYPLSHGRFDALS